MNKLSCLIIMFITCGICEAQNLVPNGDFEQYISCPTSYSQLDSALFWFNPTNASPDYNNQCANPSYAGVPNNIHGYQPAYSGGGYGGIHRYSDGTQDYREYMEVQLLSPLVANTCYYFEMYINLGNISTYTTDAIGAYFTDTLFANYSTNYVLSFVPQINNTGGNIPDTTNWTLVSGTFTATGDESYMIIGNFKNDSATNVITVNPGFDYSYVYVDNVSLTPCTAVEEQNEKSDINIYPNPTKDKLHVTIGNNELSEIILYDIYTRKVFIQSFLNSTLIDTEQLANGIYLYEVKNKNGMIKKGKIVKE